MTRKLKELEQQLTQLAELHQPELSDVYIKAIGKFSGTEVGSDDIQLFTKESADRIYTFMRHVLGPSPIE